MGKENYGRIDLHRPYVDEIFLVSPSGKKMTRETDLIDVWFDSGSMPYAQTGLRGKDTPDFGCTADFIAEGVDQTRGWFYTLHAIHTMVSGTPAFRRVISNGLVLDRKGEKMSKRLGNAVDPFKALDSYGPDALRQHRRVRPGCRPGALRTQASFRQVADKPSQHPRRCGRALLRGL